MKSRTDERTEGALLHLELAIERGVVITMMPNGNAFVSFPGTPEYRGISYASERGLGNLLATTIVDAGGTWQLRKIA